MLHSPSLFSKKKIFPLSNVTRKAENKKKVGEKKTFQVLVYAALW